MSRIHYLNGDFMEADTYQHINAMLEVLDEKYQTKGNCLFYLSTPPQFFGDIATHLQAAGLAHEE